MIGKVTSILTKFSCNNQNQIPYRTNYPPFTEHQEKTESDPNYRFYRNPSSVIVQNFNLIILKGKCTARWF